MDTKLLGLFDEALDTAMKMNKAAEWMRRARKTKPAEMPFAITGLDDPAYLKAVAYQEWRIGQMRDSKADFRYHAVQMQEIEIDLRKHMPRKVLIQHRWNKRTFAVGMTQCGVFQIQILRDDWNIGELIALGTSNRALRIQAEWEHLARRLL